MEGAGGGFKICYIESLLLFICHAPQILDSASDEVTLALGAIIGWASFCQVLGISEIVSF